MKNITLQHHPNNNHSFTIIQAVATGAIYTLLLLSFQNPSVAAFSVNKFSSQNTYKNTNIKMAASTTAAVASSKLVGKLKPSTTAFFLCDIQERFRPLIYNSETIISTSKYLTSVASTLSIPIVATQQYTKVFGPTVADCFIDGQAGIDMLLNSSYDNGVGDGDGGSVSDGNGCNKLKIFDKKKFSMMTDDVMEHCQTKLNFNSTSPDEARNSIVLFGIEAHVCVQQTCLDLIEMGKDVHVVVDCVSSQQGYDREIALRRMENAGAYLTTAQSLAFMLMESADHPKFKEVSKLTVGHMKLPNQFNDAYK